LYNEDTGKTRKINQGGKAKLVYLEPGSYCFYSTDYAQLEYIKVLNPLCFNVADEGITNVGTWVLGLRLGGGFYCRLLDMKENFSELESIMSVSDSTPAIINFPKNNKASVK
jgi:hypothetical protein